jgi:hypothetical protein
VCCGLLITILACGGGSHRLGARDYVREASQLCRRANRVVARIEIPPLTGTRGSSRAASRAVARVVVVQRSTLDELRDVRPPGPMNDTVQKWLALLDQGADELERMSASLRAGRTDEAVDFGAKAGTLLDRARELVAAQRMTSCHGPVLPTV